MYCRRLDYTSVLVYVFICVCFFFSSRRRHTRLQGDWSSDVCSSDLYLIGLRIPGADSVVQRSFWADERADEEKIWKDFLQIITNIDNPQLIYYGDRKSVV